MRKAIYIFILVLSLATAITGAWAIDSFGKNESHRHGAEKRLVVFEKNTCLEDPSKCDKVDAWGFAYQAMEIYNQQVSEYLNAVEQDRLAKEAEEAAKKPTGNYSQSFDMPAECEGKIIPSYIIMRESRCNYGSVNVNGCGGAGCYGMYQIHGMHWTNGACSDLDWTIPAHQDECAYRLSSGGTNLRPWAF